MIPSVNPSSMHTPFEFLRKKPSTGLKRGREEKSSIDPKKISKNIIRAHVKGLFGKRKTLKGLTLFGRISVGQVFPKKSPKDSCQRLIEICHDQFKFVFDRELFMQYAGSCDTTLNSGQKEQSAQQIETTVRKLNNLLKKGVMADEVLPVINEICFPKDTENPLQHRLVKPEAAQRTLTLGSKMFTMAAALMMVGIRIQSKPLRAPET